MTEFFDGAVEIGDAEVDDQMIDEGLALVRRLWDAGLAHRDIKPANILVRDGHLVLIDVAFAQVRPSPWRQAVDLANMMLVLAVRTDAERVYRRALAYFTPDEIAEAFAAARGVASPTQLRMALKHDGRDLLAEFRALAPRRRPISLQRWGPRRVAMAVAVVLGGYLAVTGVYQMMAPAQLNVGGSPTCGTSDLMVLLAQAVPTTPGVPCLQEMPAGWTVERRACHQRRGSLLAGLRSRRSARHLHPFHRRVRHHAGTGGRQRRSWLATLRRIRRAGAPRAHLRRRGRVRRGARR